MREPVIQEVIERKIYWMRGQKMMLSADLAELYEVTDDSIINGYIGRGDFRARQGARTPT